MVSDRNGGEDFTAEDRARVSQGMHRLEAQPWTAPACEGFQAVPLSLPLVFWCPRTGNSKVLSQGSKGSAQEPPGAIFRLSLISGDIRRSQTGGDRSPKPLELQISRGRPGN